MPAKTSTPHNGAEEEGLLTSESGSRLMTLQTTEGRLPLAEVLQRNLPAVVNAFVHERAVSWNARKDEKLAQALPLQEDIRNQAGYLVCRRLSCC